MPTFIVSFNPANPLIGWAYFKSFRIKFHQLRRSFIICSSVQYLHVSDSRRIRIKVQKVRVEVKLLSLSSWIPYRSSRQGLWRVLPSEQWFRFFRHNMYNHSRARLRDHTFESAVLVYFRWPIPSLEFSKSIETKHWNSYGLIPRFMLT